MSPKRIAEDYDDLCRRADDRIEAQISTKAAAIFCKSTPTLVSTNTIVPRGTISEVWSAL
jgi:hypothetical protein